MQVSIKNSWKYLFTGVLFALAPAILSADATAEIGNPSVIYHDHNHADIRITIPRCEYRCELFRNSTLVKEWHDQENGSDTLYYSGAGGPAEWKYRNWSDTDDGDVIWVEKTIYIDPSDPVQGTLHNDQEWLTKLGRGKIKWSDGVMDMGIVRVVGGIELTGNMIDFVQNDASLSISGEVGGDLSGISFINSTASNIAVSFYGLSGSSFTMSIDPNISFSLRNSQNVSFRVNMATGKFSDYLDLLNHGYFFIDGDCVNTEIYTSTIPYLRVWGESTTIYSLNGNYIELFGNNNNIYNSNITGQINISGNGNQVDYNEVIKMQPINNFGFLLDLGPAIKVGGDGHKILSNVIKSGYTTESENAIEVSGTSHTIDANQIGSLGKDGKYKSGITLKGTLDVEVKNNTIESVSQSGIRLTDNAESSLIKENFIEVCQYGIEIQNASSNDIINNVIHNASSYGLFLYALSPKFSNDNIIEKNEIVSYQGLDVSCIGGCDNATPQVSGTVITDNIIHYEKKIIEGYCPALFSLSAGTTGIEFYQNYVDSGCAVGIFRSYDSGVDNLFYDQILGGNWWDNYADEDNDGDGFGDTPYDIGGPDFNQDMKPLIGDPGILNVTPTDLDFGTVTLTNGTHAVVKKILTLTNIDNVNNLKVFSTSFVGTDSSFFTNENENDFPIILMPGDTHDIVIAFQANSVGLATASMLIRTQHLSSRIELSGLVESEDPRVLKVNVISEGRGLVRGHGIYCPDMCTQSYAAETVVGLEALPESGYTFRAWSGDCLGCGSDNLCTININSNKECTAEFTSSNAAAVAAYLLLLL